MKNRDLRRAVSRYVTRPKRTRDCIHGGDPWTTTSYEMVLFGRIVEIRWSRSLMGGRPCGLPGHAVHAEGGIVTGLQ